MTDEELDRAAAFEELIRDRCAERVVETRFGPALFNDTFARIWNLNVVRAERPGDATAKDIAAEVDRLRAAGVPFRNDIVKGPGGQQILVEDPAGNVVELFQPAAGT